MVNPFTKYSCKRAVAHCRNCVPAAVDPEADG